MNTRVDSMIRFAFCPHYMSQMGPLEDPSHECLEMFRTFITYVYGKQLEVSQKVSWKQALDRWTKLYWADKERESFNEVRFNKSLIALKRFHDWYISQKGSVLAVNFNYISDVYEHRYNGQIPVVLNHDDSTVTLVFVEPLGSVGESSWNGFIRYAALAVDSKVKLRSIVNLSFYNFSEPFKVFEFNPSTRFFETCLSDAANILQSMQDGASYVNSIGCKTCPIRLSCEALKGDGSSSYMSRKRV